MPISYAKDETIIIFIIIIIIIILVIIRPRSVLYTTKTHLKNYILHLDPWYKPDPG